MPGGEPEPHERVPKPRESVTTTPRGVPVVSTPLTTVDEEKPAMPLMHITHTILKIYGRTPGCPRCEEKGNRARHTRACRDRIELAMVDEATTAARDRDAKDQSTEETKKEMEKANEIQFNHKIS